MSATFLALVIASCGSEPAAPFPPPLPRLDTYAVQAGAEANGRSWDGVVQALAGLCHNLIYTVAPQRILVGGGVAMGQPHLLPGLRRAVIDSLAGYGVADRIEREIETYLVHPALGARAGPLGAVALGLDALAAS